jgi:cobalt-precorrin 5A hydrolase
MGGNQAMIAAGIGFSSTCSIAELEALLASTGARIDALATPSAKAATSVVIALAARSGLKLCAIDAETLDAVQPLCVTRSDRAARETGIASVAEGCALAAAGPGARLILPRIASRHATCALAEGPGA